MKVPIVDLKEDGTFTKTRTGEKFSSRLFADAAIDFLKNHDSEKPFYAYVSFTSPHDPRQPPKKFMEMYNPDDLPLPKNFKPQHPFHNGWMTGRDEVLAPWPRTPEIIRSQLAEYYGMITHMDLQMGRILKTLRRSGHAENTYIVYAADHGLAVGSHGLLGKQNLYEHSMGAPLIMSGPGIPSGKSSDALVYLYDIFPSVCELAGVSVPEKVEGQSLIPICEGEKKSIRDSLFTTYEDIQRAVRTDEWKLIRYTQINKTQLFNLKDDPDELNNLADDPKYRKRVDELMALLKDWQQKTDDGQPLTSKNPKSSIIDFSKVKRKADRHQPAWIVEKYFNDQSESK